MAQLPDNSPAYAAPGPAPQSAGLKWFLVITFGLIVVIGALVASFYLSDNTHPGVKVIRMEGTLSTGDFSDESGVGSEYVGDQLREAADDPMVEAIVIRVDSPGGTPAAAEEIISDMEYAKAKKPVVVSMGDMATSAAYYVSAHADRIYASPDTFTGAVGVIWTFSDLSNWMKQEGYNVTVVKSGDKKDMGSSSRPMTTDERSYAQQIVNDSFERFITDVTTQRMIARSDIEDGRVITGEDALRFNLIDKIGNLNDAIAGAKELAEERRK